mmetsp:Transcript_23746/g.26923  ORF Transcript_23746/g.26923 Transcript_23746/m.26923 type:complete len:513 (+) Transcript_23746:807-2345(+)
MILALNREEDQLLKQEGAILYKERRERLDNLTFIQTWIEIFKPFYRNNHRVVVGDAFYYPTRILTVIAMSVIGVIYIYLRLLSWLYHLKEAVLGIKTTANVVALEYLQRVSEIVWSSLHGSASPSNDQISPMVDTAKLLGVVLDEFYHALRISFTLAATISMIIFGLSMLDLLYNFRQRVLRARKGSHDYVPLKVSVRNSVYYAGIQISNAILCYLLIFFIIGVAFMVPIWGVTRDIIWYYRIVLLILIATKVANYIVSYGMLMHMSSTREIRHRRGFALYEMYQFYLVLFTGIITALIRIIIWLGVSMISLMRLTECLFPAWIYKIINLDTGNKSYLACVELYHCCNHPILLTFSHYLNKAVKEHRLYREAEQLDPARQKRRLMYRNKWYLFLLLSKNRFLCKYRAHYVRYTLVPETYTHLRFKYDIKEDQLLSLVYYYNNLHLFVKQPDFVTQILEENRDQADFIKQVEVRNRSQSSFNITTYYRGEFPINSAVDEEENSSAIRRLKTHK